MSRSKVRCLVCKHSNESNLKITKLNGSRRLLLQQNFELQQIFASLKQPLKPEFSNIPNCLFIYLVGGGASVGLLFYMPAVLT